MEQLTYQPIGAKLVSISFETIDTLIADESTFDSNQFGPGWMWDEGHWWHAARH